MTDTIRHQGIIESINGTHISVKIIQTSACSACSAQGLCNSSESKEKLIDIVDSTSRYHVGDEVVIIGQTSMGTYAVLLAFVIPLALLIVSLFTLMAFLEDELAAAIISFMSFIPYYLVLFVHRKKLKKKFSFTINPL